MTASKLEATKKLLSERMPPREIAQTLGISVSTLYRWCPAADRFADKAVMEDNYSRGI